MAEKLKFEIYAKTWGRYKRQYVLKKLSAQLGSQSAFVMADQKRQTNTSYSKAFKLAKRMK